MGKKILYDKEAFDIIVEKLKLEYANLEGFKEKLETINAMAVEKDCWSGSARNAFKEKGKDAVKRFNHAITALGNIEPTMMTALNSMLELDRRTSWDILGYTADPYNGAGNAKDASMRNSTNQY